MCQRHYRNLKIEGSRWPSHGQQSMYSFRMVRRKKQTSPWFCGLLILSSDRFWNSIDEFIIRSIRIVFILFKIEKIECIVWNDSHGVKIFFYRTFYLLISCVHMYHHRWSFLTDSADLIVVQVQSCIRQISDFDTRLKIYKLDTAILNLCSGKRLKKFHKKIL